MPISRAVVPTGHAGRYLQQLCKHWSHKFQTEFAAEHGRVALPLGDTVLSADAQALTVEVDVPDPGDLERMKSVIEDHLRRFAFRETLEFDWR